MVRFKYFKESYPIDDINKLLIQWIRWQFLLTVLRAFDTLTMRFLHCVIQYAYQRLKSNELKNINLNVKLKLNDDQEYNVSSLRYHFACVSKSNCNIISYSKVIHIFLIFLIHNWWFSQTEIHQFHIALMFVSGTD